MRLILTLLTFLLATPVMAADPAPPAQSEAQSAAQSDEPALYKFDASHTSMLFFIDHLGYSKMIGEFHDFDGELMLDAKNPEKSTITVTIRPGSVDTDVPELDKKLVDTHYFNVAAHPTATFKSTRVEMTGDKTAKVTGDFTLLGVTKPVTLNVTLNKMDNNPYMGPTAGFSVTGHIFRSAFGMNEGLPFVGDRVDLMIETELNKVQPDQPS